MSHRGRFVWYDLLTPDVEGAKAFFREVLGWDTQDFGEGPSAYPMWTAGGVPLGGVMKLPEEMTAAGVPPHWMGHVTVEDVDASARRAAELGARIMEPPTDIPEVGRFSVLVDPQGAPFSLFRPNDREGGGATGRASQPGFVGWHELHAKDWKAAWEFYSALLGWEHSGSVDMGPMGEYFMFRPAGDPEESATGGMLNGVAPDGGPAHWLFYVNVEDLDATLERVRSAGGRVLRGPDEVPGGQRVAQCLDAQGGAFAVVS